MREISHLKWHIWLQLFSVSSTKILTGRLLEKLVTFKRFAVLRHYLSVTESYISIQWWAKEINVTYQIVYTNKWLLTLGAS